MAEIYPPGRTRLFYRSSGFTPGLSVTANVLSSSLVWINGLLLYEVGDGIYYLDVEFSLGTYSITFFENGEPVTTQNFLIKSNPSHGSEDSVLRH